MTLRKLSSRIVEAGRSINIALLRIFLRLVPSENHRVFAVRHLPVVDRRHGSKLIGLLTMSDVVRAHARAALEAGDPDRTVAPAFSDETGLARSN